MNVLTLNAGSSSFKFKLLRMAGDESVLAQGQVDQWGAPKAVLQLECRFHFVEKRDRIAHAG
jgi:acetate kinase